MDVAIVGKGPAGWSCAMTARMRGLSTVIIAPKDDASMLRKAERVDNYPGLPQVGGEKMLDIFRQQALSLGVEEQFGLVRNIMPAGEGFMLLVENEVIEARTVVLCMGAGKPVLLPGEEELVGRGVSYCATCDGMFYRGKRVAMISSTEQGAEETQFLGSVVGQLDYYIGKNHRTDGLSQKAQVIGEKVKALAPDENGIRLTTDQGEHVYDGVFIYRSAVALDMLLPDLQVEGGAIVTDRTMATSIPGVFAAGDCTGKPLQIPKAVGEGNIAALSAAEYLTKLG